MNNVKKVALLAEAGVPIKVDRVDWGPSQDEDIGKKEKHAEVS